jgi:hypothetical protein
VKKFKHYSPNLSWIQEKHVLLWKLGKRQWTTPSPGQWFRRTDLSHHASLLPDLQTHKFQSALEMKGAQPTYLTALCSARVEPRALSTLNTCSITCWELQLSTAASHCCKKVLLSTLEMFPLAMVKYKKNLAHSGKDHKLLISTFRLRMLC